MKHRKRQSEYIIYDVTDNDVIVMSGNIEEVADYLGLGVQTVYNRLGKHQLYRFKYKVEKAPKEEEEE